MGNVVTKLSGRIDGGYARAMNTINTDNYNTKAVAQFIRKRQLAPFYADDPKKIKYRGGKGEKKTEKEWLVKNMIECPICINQHPKNINRTCCCKQPICTRCFVQLKMKHNRVITCPYCNCAKLSVLYSSPYQMIHLERQDQMAIDRLQVQEERGIEMDQNQMLFYYARDNPITNNLPNYNQVTEDGRSRRERQWNVDNPYRPPPHQAHPSHRTYCYAYASPFSS